MNDSELLQRYAETRCEAAFAELVKRYLDFVYSAAVRQVAGDAHLAQDVTQSVFIDLARKGSSLSSRTILAGWLYTSTRFAAAKAVRAEQRRHAREQEAHSMEPTSYEPGPEPSWEQLRPVLDEAMHQLNERDRNALLLRYFEDRRLAEIGQKLGLSEDAARKRVTRALDTLRGLLAKRGVTSTATGLAAVLASQAVTAAPAALASNMTAVALAGAATATGSTLTLVNVITMTKLKVGFISALVLAGVATPLVIQHQNQVRLTKENLSLHQENTQLADQVVPLAAENARLSNLLAQPNLSLSAQGNASNELLRLRGEVARLREDARESARRQAGGGANDSSIEATVQELAARATQLRQRLEQMPDKKIPELQFLNNKDWLDAVAEVKHLDTDEDFRQALSNLRGHAKSNFGSILRQALKQYTRVNGEMLPTDLSQLQPYFEKPVEDALLQRYQLLMTGKLSDVSRDQALIAEIAPPADDEYDLSFKFHLTGTSSSSVSRTGDALEAAAMAYAAANNGLLPRDPTQLTPFLQRPVDPARVQQFLGKIPPNITTVEQLRSAHR